MAHVSQKKKDIVDDFAKLAKEYPIVGAVNMEGLPAPQLQTMRAQLREKVELKMTKKRLIKLALEKAGKKDLEKLIPFLKGQPAIIFTKENPFKLYKTINKNKSTAPAKAGQIAPKDIIVSAGPTPFAPGPVIGELGAIGIKAGIEDGKVAIKEDCVVVKEGEEINSSVAAILQRLGIEPMEIGLDLIATFENGDIYTKDVLNINEDEYIQNITNAHRWAFNLAMEAGIYNEQTTTVLVVKAFSDAKGLALSQDILTDETVGSILAKAESQMQSLKSLIPKSVEKTEAVEEKKIEEEPKEEITAKEDNDISDEVKEETQSSETASTDKTEKEEAKQEDEPKSQSQTEKEEDDKKDDKDKGEESAGLGALFG